MPEDSPTTPAQPRSLHRWLVSIGVGSAVAAAAGAIVAPIFMWTIRSSRDVTSRPLTSLGIVTIVIGLCVLVLVGLRLYRRISAGNVLVTLCSLAAAVLGGWSIWNVYGLYRSRSALPFIDSTGATVIAAVAALSAIAAVVLGLTAGPFARMAGGRIALCAFLAVALAIPLVTFRSVQSHRADVWHPDLTATATAPAAVPDRLGPVRYRVALESGYFPEVEAAGNGFVVDTRTGLTGYDGETGARRWHAGDFGKSGRLIVVHRDRDDAVGIVILFLYDAITAFDGSTGDVLWRREYSGDVTAATGSVDALGMSIFTAHSTQGGDSRTRFYSLDPATGQERWSRPISCSNPTLSPGIAGQFGLDCSTPTIIDAHTGDTTEVQGQYTPRAGSDVYVVSTPRPANGVTAKDVSRVMDSHGKVIDETPGTYPVSRANDGFLLLYAGNSNWVMRDYRNHRSTPLPIHFDAGNGIDDVHTAWITGGLVVTSSRELPQRLLLIDPTRPTDTPASTESPCALGDPLWKLQAVAGALLVQCSTDYVVGLVPERA